MAAADGRAAWRCGEVPDPAAAPAAALFVGRHSVRWARLLHHLPSLPHAARRGGVGGAGPDALEAATAQLDAELARAQQRLAVLEEQHGVDALAWERYHRRMRRGRGAGGEGKDGEASAEDGASSGSDGDGDADGASAAAPRHAPALPLPLGVVRVRRRVGVLPPSDLAGEDGDAGGEEAPASTTQRSASPARPTAALAVPPTRPPALPLRPLHCAELPLPEVDVLVLARLLPLGGGSWVGGAPGGAPSAWAVAETASDALGWLVTQLAAATVRVKWAEPPLPTLRDARGEGDAGSAARLVEAWWGWETGWGLAATGAPPAPAPAGELGRSAAPCPPRPACVGCGGGGSDADLAALGLLCASPLPCRCRASAPAPPPTWAPPPTPLPPWLGWPPPPPWLPHAPLPQPPGGGDELEFYGM